MAHELDFTTGRPAIAFRGAVPWHGLGEQILPEDSIDDIRIKAGLDYDVIKTPVQYTQPHAVPTFDAHNVVPIPASSLRTSKDACVLYRSDTGDDLSVVGNKYQVVQPREIVEFYRDLVADYGFQIEVVGALRGGRKVWALANTNEAFNLDPEDKLKGYLLLATSYDSSMATQARFTSVRVVCNNTLTLANSMGKPAVSVPHSTSFNADKVKLDLNIGPTFNSFQVDARVLSKRKVDNKKAVNLLLQAYFDLKDDKEVADYVANKDNEKRIEKLLERTWNIASSAPGARTDSADGTLWGLLNVVTYDVDHTPRRTADVKLDRAWFGEGDRLKQRMYNLVLNAA